MKVAERRYHALERQEVRDNRSPKEQLKVLDSRPGKAERERTRLLGQVKEKESEDKKPKKEPKIDSDDGKKKRKKKSDE